MGSAIWQGAAGSIGYVRSRPSCPKNWLDLFRMLVHDRRLPLRRQILKWHPQRPSALLARHAALGTEVRAVGGHEREVHGLESPFVAKSTAPRPSTLVPRVL